MQSKTIIESSADDFDAAYRKMCLDGWFTSGQLVINNDQFIMHFWKTDYKDEVRQDLFPVLLNTVEYLQTQLQYFALPDSKITQGAIIEDFVEALENEDLITEIKRYKHQLFPEDENLKPTKTNLLYTVKMKFNKQLVDFHTNTIRLISEYLNQDDEEIENGIGTFIEELRELAEEEEMQKYLSMYHVLSKEIEDARSN